MKGLIIEVLLPVYGLMAIGFFLGWLKRELDTKDVSELVLTVFAPALVLHFFRRSDFSVDSLVRVFAVSLGIVVVCYVLVFLFEIFFLRRRSRAFEISSVFMNSGYLGLPLIYLLFGDRAMVYAIAFSVSMTMLHFTMGLVLLQKGSIFSGIAKVLRMPVVWAIPLGLLFRKVFLPPGVEKMLALTGNATLPVMLVAIGISLSRITASHLVLGLWATLLRFGGGFVGSLVVCGIAGCPHDLRNVLAVQAALPSAVMNYVLCEQMGEEPEIAASIIFVSTAAFPLFLIFLKLFSPAVS